MVLIGSKRWIQRIACSVLCIALLPGIARADNSKQLDAASAKLRIQKKGLGAKVCLIKMNDAEETGKIIAIDNETVTLMESAGWHQTIRYDQIVAIKRPGWTDDWRFYVFAPLLFPAMLVMLMIGKLG